jgi:hypothetical protein
VPTVSREQVHRAVEKLPEDRLGAAAELLEALARHDERVADWRASLNDAEVSEIASSLREKHAPGDWILDQAVEAWLNSENNADRAG